MFATYRIALFGAQWLNCLRMLLRRFGKEDLSLIDENDLVNLLKERVQWDDLLEGRLHCANCEKALTLDNLAGFKVSEGDYQFLCDSQTCLTAAERT